MGAFDEEPVPGRGWETLLSLLDASGTQAAARYRELRMRLVRVFEWHGLSGDDLADETLHRVARKLADGEEIRSGDPVRYVWCVARLVGLEAARRAQRHQALDDKDGRALGVASADDTEGHD